MKPQSSLLPTFPWDTIADIRQRAAEHPGGLVNLSVGTPVDPVPAVAREALIGAADSPGYPTTVGTPDLQQAIATFLGRRCGVTEPGPLPGVPTIGTKELVANLPGQLGLAAGERLLIPSVAYPTYAVGGALVGAEVVCCDDPQEAPPAAMAWINYPSNPTGAVADVELLRGWVQWARRHDAVLVSDECYLEFGWEAEPVSILHPEVCAGDQRGLIAAHSLSKRSNLAGYRAGFVAGDQQLLRGLLELRKHAGFMLPAPIQAAMAATLVDTEHVGLQRERYQNRRALLRPALEQAGFRIEHSEAGLYLWATRSQNGRDSLRFLAEHGILAAPGDFYGEVSDDFVRIALTETDERIAAAAARLTGSPEGDHHTA